MKYEFYKAPGDLKIQIALLALFFLHLCFFQSAGAGSGDSLDKDISWPEFMSRHDMVWERLPVDKD